MLKVVFRTRPIVRLAIKNRMVTKGYHKGVYDWVTCESEAEWVTVQSFKRKHFVPESWLSRVNGVLEHTSRRSWLI